MDIYRQRAIAAITVPNGMKGGFRTKLRAGGLQGFRDLMADLEVRTRPIVRKSLAAKPMVYAAQRHYKSQRSKAEIDARLDADLRTIVKRSGSRVKSQPQWVDAIYGVLTQKRSNIQFGIDLHLSYDCPIVRSPRAVDLFAGAWIALSPLLDFVLTE